MAGTVRCAVPAFFRKRLGVPNGSELELAGVNDSGYNIRSAQSSDPNRLGLQYPAFGNCGCSADSCNHKTGGESEHKHP